MQNEFGEIVKNTKKKQVDFGISLKCRWNTKLNASTLANISFLVYFIPQIPIQDLNQIKLKTKRSNPKHSEEFNKVQPRVDRYLSFVHSGRHHLLFVFRWDVQRWRHT